MRITLPDTIASCFLAMCLASEQMLSPIFTFFVTFAEEERLSAQKVRVRQLAEGQSEPTQYIYQQ